MLSQFSKNILHYSQVSSPSLIRITQTAALSMNHESSQTTSTPASSAFIPTLTQPPSTSKLTPKDLKSKIFTESFQKEVKNLMNDGDNLTNQEADKNNDNEDRKRRLSASNSGKSVINEDGKKLKFGLDRMERVEDSDSDYGLKSLYARAEKWKVDKGKKKLKHDKGSNSTQSPKQKNTKPNYFLAVRLYNKDIHEKVNKVQHHIQEKNSKIKDCFIPLPTLHLTLFVMSLKNEDEKQTAIDAMCLSAPQLQKFAQMKIELVYEKLSTFSGQVVFVDLVQNDSLLALGEIVKLLKISFAEMNLSFKNENFTPHLTIMKMSRCFQKMRKAGIRRIAPQLYEKHKSDSFGSDVVKDILLCSMTDKKNEDGFYKVVASIDLQQEAKLNLGMEEETFNALDLTSYEVVPKWENEVENFEPDSSWNILNENDIHEAKTKNKNEEGDTK
eukprot:TCONS_00046040-protein